MLNGFSKVMGIGGLGTGVVFHLSENRLPGLGESRPALLGLQRDFCKLHIILHYIARFLKDWKAGVKVMPIGAVGQDGAGTEVLRLMRLEGMDVDHVDVLDDAPTLFSTCWLFPDKNGGNLTASNSASSRVTTAQVSKAKRALAKGKGRCLAVAAPETPLPSRTALLSMVKKQGGLTVASFVGSEAEQVRQSALLADTDLLCLNLGEAALLCGLPSDSDPETIVEHAALFAQKKNPDILLLVTNGSKGLYGWEKGKTAFLPALKVPVASTAGAGDAAVSGACLGLLRGLPFLSQQGPDCLRMARLISALSVMSEDTIHFGIRERSLKDFARRHDREAAW